MKYKKINVNVSTAERFKIFKQKVSGNNSDVLDRMMNFFEYNDIDLNNPDNEVLSVGKLVNKRFNAIYGMLKIMEKEQTKPTKGMLAEIFSKLDMENIAEEQLIQPKKQPRYVAKKPSEMD